ncbi:hypothetical protein L596_016923 [Steinernema carpocapsae]|uniref:Uncharacterized protein n=1 Tax=Steinernema carpocapsae TaxID=34508 RepID=A0A4U5NL50_STECR|nr:hypothetical protein L596_016923 [Steinernema carpocapsae]
MVAVVNSKVNPKKAVAVDPNPLFDVIFCNLSPLRILSLFAAQITFAFTFSTLRLDPIVHVNYAISRVVCNSLSCLISS